jgi:phosphoribosylanthranilate isomerase
LKVCGLTRAADAALAAELGADYLGFILHPASPRALTLEAYATLSQSLPKGPRRVAVMVEPSLDDLDWAQEAGFDRFQIHARHDLELARVAAWSEAVGVRDLWLAPKRPPGASFPHEWLRLADTFLVDTYHAAGFGGSGLTGDWAAFAGLTEAHPQKTWVLAGGLSPANIQEAVTSSHARFVDANSGLETAPGLKDADKLRAFAAALAEVSRP